MRLKKTPTGLLIEGTNGNENLNSPPLPTSYWNKILVETGDKKSLILKIVITLTLKSILLARKYI